MNFELVSTALAQGAKEVTRGNAPIWPMLLALFAVFYFFIIRPQQKKQKDSRQMLNTIVKGDNIVTIGGICGTITNIKEKKDARSEDDIVVIKVADSTKLEMVRSSIAKVIPKDTVTVKK